MTVAVDLGSGSVKVAGIDPSVRLARPVDPELAARVGTTTPLIRRDGDLVITQPPHDAYVRAIATALDGTVAESLAIVVPDWWTTRARELVEETLRAHTSGPFRLASPAIAATVAARERQGIPTTVAVLDIGAESSSTTILTETEGVHRMVARPGVLHGQAGNDIDRRLMQHVLGWLVSEGRGYELTDAEVIAAGQSLLTQVKAAKELLSTRPAAALFPELPGENVELRLVRSEFDEVARETVEAIVAMVRATIEMHASDDVEAVLLIGGSVSIPLVTQVISVELGLPVILDQEPATLAVRGATTMEVPGTSQRKGWRRRRNRNGSLFDLSKAPMPESEPLRDLLPTPAHVQSPEGATPEPDGSETGASIGRRLSNFIDRSRREAVAALREVQPVPDWAREPAHIVIEAGDAPWQVRAAHWASATGESERNSSRPAYVDEDGHLRLRVNDRDFDVDLGTRLASSSVALLLMGLNVFVTVPETGELLRELALNPARDFRPE